MTFKRLGLVVLVAGYAVSAWLVWRHAHPPGAAERITIRLCHWQLEGTVREGLVAVARRYEQLHPEVKIEILAASRSWRRGISSRFPGRWRSRIPTTAGRRSRACRGGRRFSTA